MAGLFFLAALAARGGLKAGAAIQNQRTRTNYNTTYPLGNYTTERYYFDVNGKSRLCSNNHIIIPDGGKWLDVTSCPYKVVYDEFAEKAKHSQKMLDQSKPEEKRSVYLKVNPRTYPYGAPAFFETKTNRQIALLEWDSKSNRCYLAYFDESQRGGIYRVDRNKYDWDTRKEISDEYYEELKRDIQKFKDESPDNYDLSLAYSLH